MPELLPGFYELIIRQGFGFDAPCSLFLGTVKGRPVETSRLFPVGGVAEIRHVATLTEAHGKGYGTAMTLAAAQAGHERGYRFGVVLSSPAGYGIYRLWISKVLFHRCI